VYFSNIILQSGENTIGSARALMVYSFFLGEVRFIPPIFLRTVRVVAPSPLGMRRGEVVAPFPATCYTLLEGQPVMITGQQAGITLS
jgi:hypothetical protein